MAIAPAFSSVGFFQPGDVPQHLCFAGHAHEVKGQHFHRALGRLGAGPEVDQQAGDDRAVHLDHDSLRLAADQVPASQNLLEEAEKDLDGVAIEVDQGDDLGRHLQQIGGDHDRSAIARSGILSLAAAAFLVLLGLDDDEADGMIRPGSGLAGQPHADQGIADHSRPQRRIAQQPLLIDCKDAVFLDAADVGTANGMDVVEESKLRVPAVEDVAVVFLELAAQHVLLIALAAAAGIGQLQVAGHAMLYVIVRVQPPGVFAAAIHKGQPPGGGDAGDGIQHRAIDGGEDLFEIHQPRIVADGIEFGRELLDDRLQLLGIKNPAGLAEGAEGKTLHAQLRRHLLDGRRLLQAANRIDQRVEEVEQDQRDILIKVQLAIAGAVALATGIMERLQERQQVAEAFEPADLPWIDLGRIIPRHLSYHALVQGSAQAQDYAIYRGYN